jgi:hypothetical protein
MFWAINSTIIQYLDECADLVEVDVNFIVLRALFVAQLEDAIFSSAMICLEIMMT